MTATPTASEPEPLWFTFNDLSTRVPAPVREVGRAWMNGLLDAIGMFMNGRPATLVSVDEAVLWSSQLATGYTVTDWLADADRDQKRLLMRIATKTGFPEEAGQALRDRFLLSEFLLTDDESPDAAADARALGMAFLLRGIAVSLPSEARWRETTIVLRHVWLDERGAEVDAQLNRCTTQPAARRPAIRGHRKVDRPGPGFPRVARRQGFDIPRPPPVQPRERADHAAIRGPPRVPRPRGRQAHVQAARDGRLRIQDSPQNPARVPRPGNRLHRQTPPYVAAPLRTSTVPRSPGAAADVGACCSASARAVPGVARCGRRTQRAGAAIALTDPARSSRAHGDARSRIAASPIDFPGRQVALPDHVELPTRRPGRDTQPPSFSSQQTHPGAIPNRGAAPVTAPRLRGRPLLDLRPNA